MMVCRRVGNLTHMVQRGLLVAGLVCSAHAQRDQPQPVTLQQAVAEAVDKNLTVLAEKYNVPVAQARIITARLRPNPILSIEGDHLNLLPPRYNSENMAGPPEYSIRTDFVFERGAKRQRRIDVAEAAVSTAQLQFLNTIRSVVLDVQSAYVELLQAKADLALARETLEVFHETVQINTSRVRRGDLAEVELIRTQVAELQFENTVAQASLRVETGRARLQVLLGRAADRQASRCHRRIAPRRPRHHGGCPARTRLRIPPRLSCLAAGCRAVPGRVAAPVGAGQSGLLPRHRIPPAAGPRRHRKLPRLFLFEQSSGLQSQSGRDPARAPGTGASRSQNPRPAGHHRKRGRDCLPSVPDRAGIAPSGGGNHARQGDRRTPDHRTRLSPRRGHLSRFPGRAEGLHRHGSTAQTPRSRSTAANLEKSTGMGAG